MIFFSSFFFSFLRLKVNVNVKIYNNNNDVAAKHDNARFSVFNLFVFFLCVFGFLFIFHVFLKKSLWFH